MLKQLRRFHSSLANRILYSVLALAFIGWGVGTFGQSGVDVVAEVHGTRITRRELDRETALLQRRYEQLFKSVKLARMPDLRSQALDSLIDSALVQHELRSLGLDVTDDQLVVAITRMPELQENGRFNRELLSRILDSQRDRGEFEESLRRDIREQRLHALVGDGVQVSPIEVEERYKLDREQVNLAFVRVSAADLAKTATVSDQDLEAEVAAHPERYRAPATVRALRLYRRASSRRRPNRARCGLQERRGPLHRPAGRAGILSRSTGRRQRPRSRGAPGGRPVGRCGPAATSGLAKSHSRIPAPPRAATSASSRAVAWYRPDTQPSRSSPDR